MFCIKCDKELSACTCADLGERVEKLAKCDFLVIAPDTLKRYREQAARNERAKSEQTQTE